MEPKAQPKAQKQAKGVHPGPHVEEFANALDNCLAPGLSPSEKRARLLDLPRKFHENAIRRLIQKRPRRVRDGKEDFDMDMEDGDAEEPDQAELDELTQLEREIQTWDLVRRLVPLRCAEAQPKKPLPAVESRPPRELVDADPILKERCAVLQWLQTNAASGPDIDELARELQQNADRGDIIAHGWLHTRSKIKLRKTMTAWPHLLDRQSPSVGASHLNSDGAPLVTQLDPDASTRQGRKLEPQDEYFERAIWLGCFEHLRRGSSLQTIREWCQERTEMWRAVSMSGILLPADGKEIIADAPPASLVLWRRMCLSLARGTSADDYERAVYGLLSGDIASVEKVAETWDDFLFANYNALVRTQIDTHLLGQSPPHMVSVLTQSFPSFDAVQFHGESQDVEKRLVATLETQKSTREEALEPNKALQAALIANDIDSHLYRQALVLTEDANRDGPSLLLPPMQVGTRDLFHDKERNKYFGLNQHEGLRVACHVHVLLALLRQLDGPKKDGLDLLSVIYWRAGQEAIVAAYTDYLTRCNLKELIPLYCSTLQTPRRYEVLSWNMIQEQDADRRVTQLKLIKRVGIDVFVFVRTLSRLMFDRLDDDGDRSGTREPFSIIWEGPPTVRQGRGIKADFLGDDFAVMAPKDEYVIRSLEWLMQVQEAWPEVLRIGVRVYKFFFRNSHMLAARRLMERVQLDAILQNVYDREADAGLFDDVDFWAQQVDGSDITVGTPQQVMVDARNYRELENLARALDSLETMGSLIRLSTEYVARARMDETQADETRAPDGSRTFWSGVGDAVKVMKERMQPLLGSWLLTSIEEGDKELGELRQTYLPEAILAYVSGLHYAGTGLSRDNLLECMELASLVAERQSNLAAAFIKAGRMRELVEAFTACSKALATAKGSKGAAGSSSKRLRETGWSRDLWTVKP